MADRLVEMVSGLPDARRRTLTWDRSVEMARWPRKTLGIRTPAEAMSELLGVVHP